MHVRFSQRHDLGWHARDAGRPEATNRSDSPNVRGVCDNAVDAGEREGDQLDYVLRALDGLGLTTPVVPKANVPLLDQAASYAARELKVHGMASSADSVCRSSRVVVRGSSTCRRFQGRAP